MANATHRALPGRDSGVRAQALEPPRSMPEQPATSELLRSLGKLVRGLSALFWGLPIALVVCFYTVHADYLKSYYRALPAIAATGLLVYGVWQLGDFQRQERVWRDSLDRAKLLSIINFGLSPFLYWWNVVPENHFFALTVGVLCLSGLLFLTTLNLVIRRLGAMLPDEGLRLETTQFTALNINILAITVALLMAYAAAIQVHHPPRWLAMVFAVLERGNMWVLVLLVLLPLAMTMALLWKTKQVILDSVFGAER